MESNFFELLYFSSTEFLVSYWNVHIRELFKIVKFIYSDFKENEFIQLTSENLFIRKRL